MMLQSRYHWINAGAMGFLGYVVWGIGFYALPVFYVPLQQEFGLTRTALTSIGALTILTYSLSGPIVGVLLDTAGVRKVVVAGTALFGISLAFFAFGLSRYGGFSFVGGLNGIACACVSLMPSQILVSRWFERDRGFAMGLILTLMALGGVVNATLTGTLIGWIGWRHTAITFDLMVWAVAVPVGLFVIKEKAGQTPVSTTPPADESSAEGLTLSEAVRSRQFYLICCGIFLNMAVGNAVLQNLVLYVSDLGHGLKFGAFVMSGFVMANLVARLVIGAVSDRISLRLGLVLSYACLGSSVLVLLLASGKLLLITGGLLAGFGYGGSILTTPVLTSALFGSQALGRILGIVLFSLGAGSAVGTFLVGKLFDASKSYQVAFSPLVIFAIASLAVICLIRLQPVKPVALGGARRRSVFKFALGRRH